jgi:hypothetical protein
MFRLSSSCRITKRSSISINSNLLYRKQQTSPNNPKDIFRITTSHYSNTPSLSNNDNSNNNFRNEYLEESIPTEGEWAHCSRRFMSPLQVPVRGADILSNPLYNKGTAFKTGERDRLRFRKYIYFFVSYLFEHMSL